MYMFYQIGFGFGFCAGSIFFSQGCELEIEGQWRMQFQDPSLILFVMVLKVYSTQKLLCDSLCIILRVEAKIMLIYYL